ncbi:MAG: nucleotidyl transferase AbiEii/AbiGii toxin family protein [Fibrobacterales bacterium]
MINITNIDTFFLWVLELFSKEFPSHAILKGGMSLRLLGCPRNTKDLDFLFIPYSSKKEVAPLIDSVIKKYPEIEYDLKAHSTCIVCKLSHNNIQIAIDVTVTESIDTIPATTEVLSSQYNYPNFIIRTVSYENALANKIGAWIERRLMRDIYDIHFYISTLRVNPDMGILTNRMSKITSRRDKSLKSLTLPELISLFDTFCQELTLKQLEGELNEYFSEIELIGLDMKIKVSLQKLIDFLELQT